MASEIFPKDATHIPEHEIGCVVGHRLYDLYGPQQRAFQWCVPPEYGVRLVMEAGGAQDAWGKDYTVAEFEELLRSCRPHTRVRQGTAEEHIEMIKQILSR